MPRRRAGGSKKTGGFFGAKKAAPAKSSGGFFSSKKKSPPPPSRTPPPPRAGAPAPAPSSGGGMMGGLGGMVAQGMAIGTGSAIAHQAVNGVMNSFGGSKEPQHEQRQEQPQTSAQTPTPTGACSLDQEQLYKCLQERSGDATQCQYYFDALKDCQENQRYNSKY